MNPFDRFSPYIQEYIYQKGWQHLREVQVAAARVIFEGEKNLLLAAGTASGKTEAAFFPALTLLEESPSSSVGILYISPLKALINDQFSRLEELLEEAHLPVTRWHGDVSQSQKEKLIRHPAGVLQITPESLEGMLMHRKSAVIKLFSDLRFVIIDEVHYFMSSPRGVQLLSILERIGRLCAIDPVRIGLSATLGDPSVGEKWLSTGSGRETVTPKLPAFGSKLRLGAEHFTLLHPEVKDGELSENDLAYYQFLLDHTHGKKCILFGNAKMELERVISTLKELAVKNKKEDVYLIHHGNLSASLRENTELVMKESEQKLVTGATVTLELGIDVGEMERIVQLGAPFSVSSFVQRLGRSGRRGEPAEMLFAISEYQHLAEEHLLQVIDWNFLRCIAICQLYLEDRFIEPSKEQKKPFQLLYHQTMSMLTSMGEASPAYLASQVLSLQVFSHITKEEFSLLLRHLVETGQLEKTERGGLMIGINAEHIVSDHQFLAVFETPQFWVVRNESEEIGTVLVKFPEGERFALAGHTWEVTGCDEKAKLLFVKPIPGRSNNLWEGGGFSIHTKILQKIRQILTEEKKYAYLMPKAAELLEQYRLWAKHTSLAKYSVIPIGGIAQDGGVPTYHNKVKGTAKKLGSSDYAVLPWLGSEQFLTLMLALGKMGLPIVAQHAPYWMIVRTPEGRERVEEAITAFLQGKGEMFFPWREQDIEEKYTEYLPETLKAIRFNTDVLDFSGARENLHFAPYKKEKE